VGNQMFSPQENEPQEPEERQANAVVLRIDWVYPINPQHD